MATDWRAVGIGFLAGAVSVLVPLIGQLGGGLVAGLVAGYLAGGGAGRGAWHGLLAGAIGGVLVAVLIGLAAFLSLSFLVEPVAGVFGGAAILLAGVFLAFIFAVESVLAGAIGGLVND